MIAFSSSRKYAACMLFTLMAAIISQPIVVNAGYTMNETCAFYNGNLNNPSLGGYIANPANCQGWGYCLNGQLVKTGLCGNGLLYDSRTGNCNYANLVTCSSTLQDACKNLPDPGYVADPNNCQSYAYCSNAIVQQTFNCPQYQVFNANIQQCVWGSKYSCPTNSICRLVKNNEFVGDPTKCGAFIRCQDGAGESSQCPNSASNQPINFNPMKAGCDVNYKCDAASGTPGGSTTPDKINPTICKTQYLPSKAGNQFFADGQTCFGYYACTAQDAIGQWNSCPFATHFDPTKQECVTPYTYNCPYTYPTYSPGRCGNLNLQFVAEAGCLKYTICSNQQAVGSASCADSSPNFKYFDETQGICVQTSPTKQEICNATPNP